MKRSSSRRYGSPPCSPIVYVLGLDLLIEREGDPRLEADALEELQADHAKMFYVACTRTARKLAIFARGNALESVLQRTLQAASDAESDG
jgi:hypothetical protein